LQQYEAAVLIAQKALHLRQEHFPSDLLEISTTLNNLAGLYNDMGRRNEALPYYKKAMDIIRETKGDNHPTTAIYINNVADCYINLNQPEIAEPLLLEAIDILTTTVGTEHPHTIIFINNLASAYLRMGKLEHAKTFYLKAIALAYKVMGKEHPYYLTFKGSLSVTLFQLKQYKESLKINLEIVEQYKILLGPSSIPVIRYSNQTAKCYLKLGSKFYPQALEWVEKAIKLNALEAIEIGERGHDLTSLSTRTFKSNDEFRKSLVTLSKIQQAIYKNNNDKEFLLESYKTQKVLAYFIQHRQDAVYTKKDKLNILKGLVSTSSRAMELIKELEKAGHASITNDAITFAEYNKSAVLSSTLQGNQAINFGEIPDSLKSQERTLKKEKAAAKKKIIQATIDEDKETLKMANQELVEVQLEQDKMRQLLKDNYPKYNALKNEQKTLTTTIIQEQLLNPQSALLEYCVYDSAVYVIVITPSTVQLQRLPIEKDKLQAQIKNFRKSLSNHAFIVNHEKEAYLLYTQTAFYLHQVLIAPIQKHLTNTQQLIIVPDNDLGHIPFETLLSTLPNQQVINYQSLDYLLHDYTISYSYAAALLLENKRYQNSTNNGKILGFAASYNPNDSIASYRSPSNQKLRQVLEPLPAAIQEIEILQEQFPNGDFFFGKAATEALFKEKAANYSVLHLAMHGMVNHQFPLLSCLAFSEDYDTTENNFLEAHEISNLQLSNDLVVLSACQTGYGEFEQGEGVMSLARSFMYAGTPSLVVSLWEVNDLSTAAIMQLFYKNLAKGMTKDEALRQVKLEFLKNVDDEIAHPIYWSAFIVLGDNQPVHLTSTMASWQWGAIGGGTMLVGLLFLWVRKRKRQQNVA
jgi:CHAT domain-containing protein